MSLRLMVMLALAALTAAACDHDTAAGDGSTEPFEDQAAISGLTPSTSATTSAAPTTVTTTSSIDTEARAEASTSSTTTTTSEVPANPAFAHQLADVLGALEAVGDEMCDLMKVFELEFDEQPTTQAQVTSAVDATVQLLGALAAVAPPDDARVFNKTAEAFQREAAAHDHSPEWMTGYTEVIALASDEFLEAIEHFQEMLWNDCLESDGRRGEKP